MTEEHINLKYHLFQIWLLTNGPDVPPEMKAVQQSTFHQASSCNILPSKDMRLLISIFCALLQFSHQAAISFILHVETELVSLDQALWFISLPSSKGHCSSQLGSCQGLPWGEGLQPVSTWPQRALVGPWLIHSLISFPSADKAHCWLSDGAWYGMKVGIMLGKKNTFPLPESNIYFIWLTINCKGPRN